MKVYIVYDKDMYESESYVVGVFSTKDKAEECINNLYENEYFWSSLHEEWIRGSNETSISEVEIDDWDWNNYEE